MAALELIMDEGVAHGMSKLVYVFVFEPHLFCDMHLSLVNRLYPLWSLQAPQNRATGGRNAFVRYPSACS